MSVTALKGFGNFEEDVCIALNADELAMYAAGRGVRRHGDVRCGVHGLAAPHGLTAHVVSVRSLGRSIDGLGAVALGGEFGLNIA